MNLRNKQGNTALHLAAIESSFDVAATLLQARADKTIKNKKRGRRRKARAPVDVAVTIVSSTEYRSELRKTEERCIKELLESELKPGKELEELIEELREKITRAAKEESAKQRDSEEKKHDSAEKTAHSEITPPLYTSHSEDTTLASENGTKLSESRNILMPAKRVDEEVAISSQSALEENAAAELLSPADL